MTRRLNSRTTWLVIALAVLSGPLFLPTTTLAQNPGQQLIDDAVAAMGGRDRIMAVKTKLAWYSGHVFRAIARTAIFEGIRGISSIPSVDGNRVNEIDVD